MALIFQPERKHIIVPEVAGEPFYAGSIPEAQKLALAYNQKTGGFTAPMPLLLRNFPHSDWYTANSEDLSGIAGYDMPSLGLKKGDAFVATAHGGKDGKVGVLLTSDKTELALRLWKETDGQEQRKGLNAVYAAVLDDIYEGKDVLSILLNDGRTPDNKEIGVYSFDQMLAGETPKDFTPYIVVRSLALARQTVSGYESIDRLTNIRSLSPQDVREGKETVTDSQVIVYTGGVPEGSHVIQSARKKFTSGKLGVWHSFNSENFKPDQSQGRVLFVGNVDDDGLVGNYYLDSVARFGGVAPEAPALLNLRGAPQNGSLPALDVLVGSLQGLVAPIVEHQVRERLKKFYQQQ